MDNKEVIKKLKEQQAEFNENYVDFAGVNAAYDLAIKALEEKEADRWIPVSERLPDEYEVLCCDNRKNIMIGHPFSDEDSECGYSAENEGCFMYECIAWKPLPEPYKENDK